MTGSDKDLEWFNEWSLTVRNDATKASSFDVAKANYYFKDEVCPVAFNSFRKVVKTGRMLRIN